jgi:hypothetical protein
MGAGNLARVESENIVALCDVDDVKAAPLSISILTPEIQGF